MTSNKSLDQKKLYILWYTKVAPFVSQATACDGLLYQVTPDNYINIPGPGVLPI